MMDLLKQRNALIYLLTHVDETKKDREIHKDAIRQIDKILASRGICVEAHTVKQEN